MPGNDRVKGAPCVQPPRSTDAMACGHQGEIDIYGGTGFIDAGGRLGLEMLSLWVHAWRGARKHALEAPVPN